MRNNILFAVAGAACIISQHSSAADMPVKAPPVSAIYDWSGFYVGGHVGAGRGHKVWTVPGTPTTRIDHDVSGFLGGGQIGLNYQVAKLVMGIEGDISATNMKGDSLCANPLYICTSKVHWIGTVTGRLGYAMTENALIYVKGGWAWARENFDFKATFASEDTGHVSASGWTVGGGFEYGLARNWSAKVEYNYIDFGTKRRDYFSPAGALADTVDVKQDLHLVKVGLNYRFWPLR